MAFCAPRKEPPLRNGKQIGEMCIKSGYDKTLKQCRAFAYGGCLAIKPNNPTALNACISNAMRRVKELKPNMK